MKKKKAIKYNFTILIPAILAALITGGCARDKSQSESSPTATSPNAAMDSDRKNTEKAVVPMERESGAELDKQLRLIMDNRSTWDLVNREKEEPNKYYGEENYYYAVTDLDQNGRLEISNLVTLGNSWMSYHTYYEVNEKETALIKIPEKQSPISSTLDSGPADMLTFSIDDNANWTGYYDAKNKTYHYDMDNHVYNTSHEFTDYYVDGCFSHGKWNTTTYAYYDTSYQHGEKIYSYLSGEKKEISQKRLAFLPVERFDGMTKFYLSADYFQTVNNSGRHFSEKKLLALAKKSYENFSLTTADDTYQIRLTEEAGARLTVPDPSTTDGMAKIVLHDAEQETSIDSVQKAEPYMAVLQFAGLGRETIVTNFAVDGDIVFLSAIYGEEKEFGKLAHYLVALDYKNHIFYKVRTGLQNAAQHFADISQEELTNDEQLEILVWNVNGRRSGKSLEIYRLDKEGFHCIYSNITSEPYYVLYGVKGALKNHYKLEITCDKLNYHSTNSLLDLGYTKKQLEINSASADQTNDNPAIRLYDHKKYISDHADSDITFGPLDEEEDVCVDYWKEGICGWLQMNYMIYLPQENPAGILTIEMQYDKKKDTMLPVEMEYSDIDINPD